MVAVYLFVPNLIGYLRIITGLVSFYFAFTHPGYFVGLYSFSYWLDALDGVAARHLGQSAPRAGRGQAGARSVASYRRISPRGSPCRTQSRASAPSSTW